MRRARLLILAAGTCAVVAAACNGGRGARRQGHGDLGSGLYLATAVHSNSDACAANLLEGTQILVHRSAVSDTVAMTGFDAQATVAQFKIHDGVLSGTDEVEFHWGAYDCNEIDRYTLEGATTGTDGADVTLSQTWNVLSGLQCDQAYAFYSSLVGVTVSLPCASSVSFHLQKAPAPTPTPTPSNIVGTLDTAYGFGAVVTVTSKTFAGRLDSRITADVPLALTSSSWTCFAPDPAGGFPNYDLFSTDGFSYEFDLSITTAAWLAGTVPVDGTHASFLYVDIDGSSFRRILKGTSGTATLYTAPTAINDTTQKCVFGMKDLPLRGTKDYVGFFAPGGGLSLPVRATAATPIPALLRAKRALKR